MMDQELVQTILSIVGGAGFLGMLGVWIKTRGDRATVRDAQYDAFTSRLEAANKSISKQLADCQSKCLSCEKEHGITQVALEGALARIDAQEKELVKLRDQIGVIQKAEAGAIENSRRLERLEALIAEGRESE